MEECLLKLYATGNIDEIVRQVFPTPETSFDMLSADDPFFPYIVNYFDASFFKTYQQALCACQCLFVLLDNLPNKNAYQLQALSLLEYEQRVLRALLSEFSSVDDPLLTLLDSERRGSLVTNETYRQAAEKVPEEYVQLLESQRALGNGWLTYQQSKKEHAEILKHADQGFSRPWRMISYTDVDSATFELSEKIPVIFLEPLQIDYALLLEPLRERTVLFVFETRTKLIQQLQFPSVVESLSLPHHFVYVMEVYPNQQFSVQNFTLLQGKAFEMFFLVKRPVLESSQALLQQAIWECLQQPMLSLDTEVGNWLYQVANRILFSAEEEKLGVNRSLALYEYLNARRWHDPHKGQPSADRPLGAEPIDYQKMKLSMLSDKRNPRSKEGSKIRLVHVVPQIVDYGHAPSRLLENLVLYHDKEHFELHVVSTERLQFHWMDYPYNLYRSAPSDRRAPARIDLFKKHGCGVGIFNDVSSFERTAMQVTQYLEQIHADVVIFHGPDVINNMIAQMTDVPLRVMYDHGTLPNYPGYDLIIASTPLLSPQLVEKFTKWKSRIEILPFAVDVKKGWLSEPFELKNWGVPSDALMMTTISQHLDNRLSHEMLLAIVEILQRVPNAYYVPIGKPKNAKVFMEFFQQHQVDDRVIFMGHVTNPSQYARSMYVYLNEFPFGSGLGMLDAMAAGCPVISMYDPKGPPQARYGGQYMGTDWVITSGEKSDYVDLACRLLTDPVLYDQWSKHAIQEYERHADVQGYVQAFERILETNV